ncbi:amino acid transporter [Solibacillus sp. NPDC093137]|uniref:amino acid transporter n=1 Tax=Solibacillus sp. NPDC093137 TaxID=3390678 RepID=UPI003CFD176D
MEKKPFNDADEHYQKHVGTPTSYKMKQMPKPIRLIGYFFFGFMAIATTLIILLMLLDKIL